MKISIMQYILRRLTEGSTIRNLVLFFCSMSGLTISEQQTNSVVFIILGIIGFLGVALPDNLYDFKQDLQKEDSDVGFNDKTMSGVDVVSPSACGVCPKSTPLPPTGQLGRTDDKDLQEFTSGFGDK